MITLAIKYSLTLNTQDKGLIYQAFVIKRFKTSFIGIPAMAYDFLRNVQTNHSLLILPV